MSSSYDMRPSIFGKFLPVFSNSSEYSSSMSYFVVKTIRWGKNYLLSILDGHLIHYPSPLNLTYAWSFGSSAGICLVIQLLSGIFLAMHYTPHIDLAHYARCKQRMVNPLYTCKRGFYVFYCCILSYIPWTVLRLLHATPSITLVFWCSYFYFNDGYGIYGVRTSLGTNEFLGCYGNYKFSNSSAYCWPFYCWLVMRRFYSK